MGCVLAVDWGKRRMGLAISDESKTIARTLPGLAAGRLSQNVARLEGLILQEGVDTVVVGNPLHMDGRAGTSALGAKALADAMALRLPGVRILLLDERLTSREAAELLRERGERVGRDKGRLDQVAAAILLQSYLDSVPR